MVFYFSGTGNSRYIAQQLSEQLSDELVSMNRLMRQRKLDHHGKQQQITGGEPLHHVGGDGEFTHQGGIGDVERCFRQDAEVYVKLPRFDIENKFNLNESLQAMGVNRAFKRSFAQFDRMFAPQEADYYYWIGKVIQKARISVAEWGTEAAAVTVVEMAAESAVGPGEEPRQVYFYADHPFVFVIGESTSGTILFEGVYSGE